MTSAAFGWSCSSKPSTLLHPPDTHMSLFGFVCHLRSSRWVKPLNLEKEGGALEAACSPSPSTSLQCLFFWSDVFALADKFQDRRFLLCWFSIQWGREHILCMLINPALVRLLPPHPPRWVTGLTGWTSGAHAALIMCRQFDLMWVDATNMDVDTEQKSFCGEFFFLVMQIKVVLLSIRIKWIFLTWEPQKNPTVTHYMLDIFFLILKCFQHSHSYSTDANIYFKNFQMN